VLPAGGGHFSPCRRCAARRQNLVPSFASRQQRRS
jgi:hypothetical protein